MRYDMFMQTKSWKGMYLLKLRWDQIFTSSYSLFWQYHNVSVEFLHLQHKFSTSSMISCRPSKMLSDLNCELRLCSIVSHIQSPINECMHGTRSFFFLFSLFRRSWNNALWVSLHLDFLRSNLVAESAFNVIIVWFISYFDIVFVVKIIVLIV